VDAKLLILHHDGTEEIRAVPDGEASIGRSHDNWLCPIDTAMSRHHAVLRRREDGLEIESLPTPNGTSVNGHRIEGRRNLVIGDEVVVGRTVIRLVPTEDHGDSRRTQSTVEITTDDDRDEIVAVSTVMRELLEQTDRLARSLLPVLLLGESGTGKELFAHRLHDRSPRSAGSFVVLNCPALSAGVIESELFGVEEGVATDVRGRPGRLEEADGGTLFLDEIADLPLEVQAKLLRFLQDGSLDRVGGRRPTTVDVRIVAATNRDLEAAMADGSFREDLYHRIAAAPIELPPLRQRREDIIPLAEHFLARVGSGVTLEERARTGLVDYHYPGNVRELAMIIERACVLADRGSIDIEHLGLDSSPRVGDPVRPAALLEAIASGDVDFWEAVHRPFVDRELSRPEVRALIAAGLERSGGSVRGLAALLRVEDRYRKLLDFLRNNRLLPE
jgi:transcriptional regulator with GAF, ATPase, and Fis domain